jgi:hypothetical protein
VFLIVGTALLGTQTGLGGGVVTNCTEANLRAAMAGGGAVTFACSGIVPLTATIIVTNDTTLDAAGQQIAISGNGMVRIFQICTNIQFSIGNLSLANGAATNGAALFNAGGNVNVTNCTFNGNRVIGGTTGGTNGTSVMGGAIVSQGVLALFNCNLTNNAALGGAAAPSYSYYMMGYPGGDGAGGAIWNSGLVLASGCTFAGNSAVGGVGGAGASAEPWAPGQGYPGGPGGNGNGGAIFNSGTARIVNCTMAFNTGAGGAGGQGGSSYPFAGYPPLPPGLNGAPGSGASGIYDASGQCYLTNCTLVFNSGTGILTTEINGAKLINTLLSGNWPGGNGSGAMTDLGHNLSSDLTCAFTNTGSMNNTYLLLGSLSDNGGSTLTVALLPGCRAIDMGDTFAAPPADQRGVPRPYGIAADIGAYEYNQATNPGPSTVVAECTEGDFRAAMSGGGHVTFACDGTIMLSNTVAITTDTLLDAAGHNIILRGSGTGLFRVFSNVVFSVADMVIANGTAQGGAGIQNVGGTVNTTNCVFSGNRASRGGAIQNEAGVVCLSACVFTNNQAASAGGALDNSGTMTADLCIFVTNLVAGANGLSGNLYSLNGGSGGGATGGAIYNAGTLTISRSTVTSNSVVAGSGGNGANGRYGEFSSNGQNGGNGGAGGDAEGGALFNTGAAFITSSTFIFNSATGGNGGAAGGGGGAYSQTGGTGGGGGSGGMGAGALFNMGDIRIINSTFAFNSGLAGYAGGGGAGGSSPGRGGSGGPGGNGGSGIGAICDYQSLACWITNCTLAMNSGIGAAAGAGGTAGYGGYQSGNPGTAGLAGSSSGGIKTTSGSLINTLLAANLHGGNGGVTITDLGHNLSSDATCGFTSAGSMNNTNPKLGPLANNGGPTLTMFLLPNSPAIDAGDDSATPVEDQRGLPRPIGPAVDIGAYEYGSPALLTLSRGATGGADMTVIGKRGQAYWLLASETLLDWELVSTNQFSSGGSAEFHDDASHPQRFYRVWLP